MLHEPVLYWLAQFLLFGATGLCGLPENWLNLMGFDTIVSSSLKYTLCLQTGPSEAVKDISCSIHHKTWKKEDTNRICSRRASNSVSTRASKPGQKDWWKEFTWLSAPALSLLSCHTNLKLRSHSCLLLGSVCFTRLTKCLPGRYKHTDPAWVQAQELVIFTTPLQPCVSKSVTLNVTGHWPGKPQI